MIVHHRNDLQLHDPARSRYRVHGPAPYGLGIVELPEGIRVNRVLVTGSLATLSIDAAVRFCLFNVSTADEPLPSYGYELEPR